MPLLLQTEGFRSVAGSSLTGTLANVGAATTNPAGTVLMFNGCDDEVVISWDGGTTEGFLMPPNSALGVDAESNKHASQNLPSLPIGAQFQAKHNGSAPTSGTLSITVVY